MAARPSAGWYRGCPSARSSPHLRIVGSGRRCDLVSDGSAARSPPIKYYSAICALCGRSAPICGRSRSRLACRRGRSAYRKPRHSSPVSRQQTATVTITRIDIVLNRLEETRMIAEADLRRLGYSVDPYKAEIELNERPTSTRSTERRNRLRASRDIQAL